MGHTWQTITCRNYYTSYDGNLNTTLLNQLEEVTLSSTYSYQDCVEQLEDWYTQLKLLPP